jgi:hypothetical protein
VSINCNKVERTLCHSCQLGKHVRLPFSNSSSFSSMPFELVHCDVWTSPVASISGFQYYLVLLDDFTHFCWTSSSFASLRLQHISQISATMYPHSSVSPSKPSGR